ncbi:MAG: non-hydrolyzing UDP-N-acetylglucosamine 2-epimerase [Solirubrobacteraceae bacterium]
MKILTVVGNRPQFVKAAAVSALLRERHEEILVHTGQHHDDELSAVFFDELGVPSPELWLGLSGGSNTSQLARMLTPLETVIAEQRPDGVLLYGDTNSTLAGALAAADAGVPIAHVEAGMRSHDLEMPEERNRVLVDALSSLLLCSSEAAAENLRGEGAHGRCEIVGDVMVDVAAAFSSLARARGAVLARLGLEPGAYVLATAHRAGNVDDPSQLLALVELLEAVPGALVLPLHPRTASRLAAAGLRERLERAATVCGPLGYLDFTMLLCNASVVLTDSGGVQKEAYIAGVPCVTLRERTEWVETVASGWNVLVGLDAARAVSAIETFGRGLPPDRPPLYGDGRAGERVVAALDSLL